ncbi:NAD(P)/FAD-dependent oxidoreductase [Gordonia sp. (in: high G+C Gram-positive bacteria)]|uniref:NAD(P)/FAD-dependent oxidoreductase n=1 Tax=Gordonia sp. (in: high G+C Gram-positive bacteria) TaxID=84139 RepID=UPI003528B0A8
MTRHSEQDTTDTDRDEVIVIGAGAAGLSAGLTLARARRRVTVIDGGAPRNAPAAGIHGLIAAEGISPAEYVARGRAEVTGYGGRLIDGQVDRITRDDDGFTIALDDGTTLRSRTVLVATGVRDDLPSIPGLHRHWGTAILHCPYCHGWEARDKRIGILATGPLSWMQALMFHQWSDDVVLLANGVDFSSDDLATLDRVGVQVRTGLVEEVFDDPDGALAGVRLVGGSAVDLDAIAMHSRIHANTEILAGLGVSVEENEFGTYLAADSDGRTGVPGLWAAGNIRDQMAQVTSSAADGVFVAARLNMDLIFTDAGRPVTPPREPVRR